MTILTMPPFHSLRLCLTVALCCAVTCIATAEVATELPADSQAIRFAGVTFGWSTAELLKAYPEAEVVGSAEDNDNDDSNPPSTSKYLLPSGKKQTVCTFLSDSLVEVHLAIPHPYDNEADRQSFKTLLAEQLESQFQGKGIHITMIEPSPRSARTSADYIFIEATDESLKHAAEARWQKELNKSVQQFIDHNLLVEPSTK